MFRIVIAMSALFALGACGDPLSAVQRLSEVETSDAAANVAPVSEVASPRQGGLFGRLLNRQPDDPTNAAVEAALADAQVLPEENTAPEVAEAATETQRGGLFGLFRGNRSDTGDEAPEAEVVPAAVTPAPQDAAPTRGLAGLFRRSPDSEIPRDGPDAAEVEAGTILPFGEIARVCGVRRSQLGTEIEGGGGFRIYDTNPSSTASRPFYVMGFNDNCARTFTGAVTVGGNIQSHEFVRYQPSNERISYSAADNAYEALKATECRVARGQPCGARTNQLNRTTQFITVYSFFGGTFSAVPTRWTQILLHDGEVLAVSIKDG